MASVREESAMSDFANEHMRRHHNEYTLRLPTPPRIIVPPPTHNAPPLRMVLHPDAAGLDFLRSLELEDIVQTNVLLDWTYERRRLAQMVLPWLYVGPMVAVKDQDFLRREGITMVLAVRAQPKSMTGAMNAAQAACEEVAAVDSPTFHEVISCFPQTARMINEHVIKVHQQSLSTTGQPKLGKVLVFCESGNEKAAAVVAAYLMDTLNDFDHIKAMQVCQAQRFCINFDDTLKRVLQNYWEIVQARRSVRNNDSLSNGTCQSNGNSLSNGNTNHSTSPHALKRTIDDLDDDEMDFAYVQPSDSSDALRFADRDVTPFQSRD